MSGSRRKRAEARNTGASTMTRIERAAKGQRREQVGLNQADICRAGRLHRLAEERHAAVANVAGDDQTRTVASLPPAPSSSRQATAQVSSTRRPG